MLEILGEVGRRIVNWGASGEKPVGTPLVSSFYPSVRGRDPFSLEGSFISNLLTASMERFRREQESQDDGSVDK